MIFIFAFLAAIWCICGLYSWYFIVKKVGEINLEDIIVGIPTCLLIWPLALVIIFGNGKVYKFKEK